MTEQTIPSWSDLAKLLVIAVGIILAAPVGWGFLRRKVHEGYVFKEGCISAVCNPIERHIGAIHMFGLIVLFTGVTMAVVGTLGREFILEGFALGAAVVFFVATQLPHLFNPTVGVHVQMSADGKTPDGHCRRNLRLQPESKALVFFDLVNLGMNYYKNCSIWLTFERPLEIESNPAAYENVQYKKDFTFQVENNCLCFAPGTQSMDVAVGSELCVPAIVKTPAEQGLGHATVEISCETRTGCARLEVPIEIRT